MEIPGAETETQVVRDEVADSVREHFAAFLSKFSPPTAFGADMKDEDQPADNLPYYVQELDRMREEDRTTLRVDFGHLLAWDVALADLVQSNYYRFEAHLRRAVHEVARDRILRAPDPSLAAVLLPDNTLWLGFFNMPSVFKLRELKSCRIGQLVSLSATVTRTTEVRPELLWGTFRCMDCLGLSDKVEQQFKYTEPAACKNPSCQNRRRWSLCLERSSFVDWQKCHAQENSWEVPSGSMPRSLDVILRHEDVERAKAGDKCLFTGTLIVVPDVSKVLSAGGAVSSSIGGPQQQQQGPGGEGASSEGVSGLKGFGASRLLTYKLCFLASCVQSGEGKITQYKMNTQEDGEGTGRAEEEEIDVFSFEEREQVRAMRLQPDLYRRMVQSVAPAVYGHEEIKRGVLLMMFGGVHKQTMESIQLRGDINVCIVGDPSTAKSQFLKYVCSFFPRAVFTSGKASTAAGMTASVVRDDDTGEFNIEAGALMLADNGICCIDEFDKMDISNQVAIHEAMEQQTISIAKAGIHACLNARASILAAANPIGGRYDRAKPLRANLNIGAPLMSRFDLFFIVLDDCDSTIDEKIAEHIVNVHQKLDDAVDPPFSAEQLRLYLRYAKSLKPMISPEAAKLFSEYYRKLRQGDSAGGGGKNSYRITVRQLESMIRLAEALARLHLDTTVQPMYVDEAARLLRKSIIHVETPDVDLADFAAPMPDLRHLDMPASDEADADATDEQDADGTGSQAAPAAKKAGVRLPYEQYRQIAHECLAYLRRNTEAKEKGANVSELVDWYLDQHAENMEGLVGLEKASDLLLKIVRKMRQDHVIMVVGSSDGEEAAPQGDVSNWVVTAHPDYDPSAQ